MRPPESHEPEIAWPDQRLVDECLEGNDQAWAALVEKYKNLVYSITLRRGAPPEEAADLFQSVWLQVHSKLDTLRKRDSLRSWLISMTINQCYHWRQKYSRRALQERQGLMGLDRDPRFASEPVDITEAEREEQVQIAIGELPARCQELIRLLFYTQPPLPYREVASHLGLAIGSIGFIRGRCLKKLQELLEERQIR
jgi:RNA polymerase sigma factor (sigma-70 family)